jgi:hypothetical protein
MKKNRALRGTILTHRDSLTDFAREVGMRENKLSYIIHGRIEPTQAEKETMASKLSVPVEKIFPQD